MSKSKDEKAVAIATAVKSKAAEKLAEAVGGLVDLSHNVVDYITGPKRIASVNAARNEAAADAARGSLEIAKVDAEKKSYARKRPRGFLIANLARRSTGVPSWQRGTRHYRRRTLPSRMFPPTKS